MSERSNAQILGATLVGGMLGAGIALLFAPRSGKEMRDHMKHDATSKLDRVKQSVRRTNHKAKEEMNELRARHNPLSAWEEEA